MAMSREERIKQAEERAKKSYETKDQGGFSGKQLLDLSEFGGYKKDMFYRPVKGTNHIDIIPYIVSTDKHPEGLKKGEQDYKVDVWVHRFVGASKSTFLCLQKMYGKPCPICEAAEALRRDPDADENQVKALYPKRRCYYNVINLDSKNKDQPVQIFEESHYLFERKLITQVGNKNEYAFFDIEEGKSIEFEAEEKTSPVGKSFEYGQFYFEKRPKYTEAIFKEAYPLDKMIHIPTYDEVRNTFLSIDVDEEEEAPARTRTRESEPEEAPRSRRREPEPEENPFQENLPEGFDEEKPRRTRSREVEPEEENKCPFNHRFGYDNEKFAKEKHCTACDEKIWDECAVLHDKLLKEGKIKES